MSFQTDEEFARSLDAADPLGHFRGRFLFPRQADGTPYVYLCGHSLGLQPATARRFVEQELDDWARLGVEGHFAGKTPWYSYHEIFREQGARLVGARPGEVVMMNSLTLNLHLMLATFFQPRAQRRTILIDGPAFPSDLFAVQTHLRHRGCDPHDDLIVLGPRRGDDCVRMEDVASLLDQRGQEIAVILWNGVNFFTGQFFDIERLAALARQHGCVLGLDLAHAAGNVVLRLHDWQVDFAVWCNYKYLNSGPGAVAGCFVHEKHGRNAELPRLAGWWGTDPATRFEMKNFDFTPQAGADGWQVSNPPILAMAPLRASLDLFDEAGMAELRAKSEKMTEYLLRLLEPPEGREYSIITPTAKAERGCQLSLRVAHQAREWFQSLHAAGVLCDLREPDVIRVAPVPLYNSFYDVWTFAKALGHASTKRR
jgi:kynureninase